MAHRSDSYRASSTISDSTGLISRVPRLLYWALFRLLHSNSLIRSRRSSLERPEIDSLELIISYFAWKLLTQSFSSENFSLVSVLKLSRLITSSIDSLSVSLLIIINWQIKYKHGTIKQTETTCKKIPCYMHVSDSRWLIVKIF